MVLLLPFGQESPDTECLVRRHGKKRCQCIAYGGGQKRKLKTSSTVFTKKGFDAVVIFE